MPVAIKNAGVWKVAATGKFAVLQGSGAAMLDAIKADNPVNLWPILDAPAPNMVCEDIVGTKDATWRWVTNTGTPGHPNPFDWDDGDCAVIPGGNPFRTFAATGCTVEAMFRTNPVTTGGAHVGGPIMADQNVAVPAASTSYTNILYVGSDGHVRGSIFPANLLGVYGPKVNDGRWHHVMITYNPNSNGQRYVSMYVDNQRVVSLADVTPDFTSTFNNNAQIGAGYAVAEDIWNNSYHMGGNPYNKPASSKWWYFNGEILYVAVHNRALASRINTLSSRPLAPNWRTAQKVYIRQGGIWIDSAYIGVLGTPVTPTVQTWDYDDVVMAWNAPTGGAAPASYEVQLLNEGYTVLQTATTTASVRTYRWLNLTPSTRYHMRVRAKSAAGVFSQWSGTLRVQIGKPEEQAARSEYRTRPWYASRTFSAMGAGGRLVVPNVANVVTDSMKLTLSLVNGTATFCGESNRGASWVLDGVTGADVGRKNSPWVETIARVSSTPTDQGITLTGTGWSSTGGWLGQGTVELFGTETYLYQWIETIPAVANSYW